LRVATDIYNCSANQNENEFVLAEKKEHASVISFKGEDLYQGGEMKVKSKVYGYQSVQTTFQLAQGGVLVISEHTNFGRGGRSLRGGGRGGDLDLPIFSQKIISAKLTANEKEYYFSCN
jgi:hypothetical protein